MTRAAWFVVAITFALRAAAAFSVPLTGDEAYYWEWSKRLAFGYVDHPPAVAWTIWLFERLGHSPGFVRLGFVLCGLIATLALAACATDVAGDRRAGAAAAIAFSLAPLSSLAFGSATPDGPYLASWCLALWLAVRAARFGRTLDFALLGLALGAALLARLFAFALVAGVGAYFVTSARRVSWRALSIAALCAALVYAPFLIWNADHDWVTFAFAFVHRHGGERGGFGQVLALYAEAAIAYSPGIWLGIFLCAVRARNGLFAWTALPLLALLTVYALVAKVEVYWTLGPFASLCALSGVAYARLPERARSRWRLASWAGAAPLLVLLFAAVLAPGPSYALIQRATGLQLRNSGPLEIFTFDPLARDVATLARGAAVVTDGYGFSSVLDYDANIAPVVIGYDWQGRESRAWYVTAPQQTRWLFVDKEPLVTRPDFAKHLARACHHVSDGGTRAYAYGGAPARRFYLTWCEQPVPDALAILRWEREPPEQ